MAARPGRSYSAEYASRNARSQARGLLNYAAERRMRERLRQITGITGRAVTETPPGAAPDQEPVGLQGPFGPSGDPDWDFYWPTNSKYGPSVVAGRRPKYSQMARYSARYQRMEIIFRDGTTWHWDNIPELAWDFFRRSSSTYEMIRPPGSPFQDLYGKGARGGWGSIVGQ